MARSWAVSERPGMARRNSAPCTRWIAAIRTTCTWRKSRSGAFRRSRCIRRPPVRPVGDRRPMMKRIITFMAAAGAIAVGASLVAQSVPEINFDANADLISLPSYGEVAGVATNSRGNIFVYARTGHAVATLGDERTFYHGGSRLFPFDRKRTIATE